VEDFYQLICSLEIERYLNSFKVKTDLIVLSCICIPLKLFVRNQFWLRQKLFSTTQQEFTTTHHHFVTTQQQQTTEVNSLGANHKCVRCLIVARVYQCHQQKYDQLYHNTQLEVTLNFSALRSIPCGSKIIVKLLVQKLLVKWWWNWPL